MGRIWSLGYNPHMTCYEKVSCPNSQSTQIFKAGKNGNDTQRYRCGNEHCETKSFMLEYRYKAYEPGVINQGIDMAINGSGIRDTARVLNINKNTIINALKKRKKPDSGKS